MLLWFVVLRTCTVAVKDIRDVEHSIEVTAETLYEAIATALAALQQDNGVAGSAAFAKMRYGESVLGIGDDAKYAVKKS
jgi:hypothetical protein